MLHAALRQHARRQPEAIALQGERLAIRYGELPALIDALAAQIDAHAAVVGVLLDNSPAWAVLDLALPCAGRTAVPLPGFFTDAQLAHAIHDAGVDLIVTDQPARLAALADRRFAARAGAPLALPGLGAGTFTVAHADARPRFPGIAKITYTSGTTGEPKGVRLTQAAMETVAMSLLAQVGEAALARHLGLLPLATLLENIAGVMLPLLAGGRVTLPSPAQVGLRGAAGLDAARLAAALRDHEATSAILIPQMLHALVAQAARLPHARFLAVGGAPVSAFLLDAARVLGLPVYEGYGLSECASVVSVNAPGAARAGSVGRPLPHVRLRFTDDGEILIQGAVMQGYVGGGVHDGWWPSGDLGHLDDEGYLHLTGRRKNMFITAFGRNVAPEWVERELTVQAAIAQAAVFGEAQPFNAAVIVPRAGASDAAVERAIDAANQTLPDYARVARWLRAEAPFTVANGQFTGTARLRREAIYAAYRTAIETLYLSSSQQEKAV